MAAPFEVQDLRRLKLERCIETNLNAYGFFLSRKKLGLAADSLKLASRYNARYTDIYKQDYASRFIIKELAMAQNLIKTIEDNFGLVSRNYLRGANR